jgi:hypothetical protein
LLEGASFEGAFVWRASAQSADWKDTFVTNLKKGPKASCEGSSECTWTAQSFTELKGLITYEVPNIIIYLDDEGYGRSWDIVHLGDRTSPDPGSGGDRGGSWGDSGGVNPLLKAIKTIEQRLDPAKALEGEDEMAKIWAARERETPTPEAYEKSLAKQWRETGCAAEGAPYVLHGLVARANISPFRDQSDAAKTLAADFLDEAHCPGAHGLSEADKETLKKIATRAAPKAPTP